MALETCCVKKIGISGGKKLNFWRKRRRGERFKPLVEVVNSNENTAMASDSRGKRASYINAHNIK